MAIDLFEAHGISPGIGVDLLEGKIQQNANQSFAGQNQNPSDSILTTNSPLGRTTANIASGLATAGQGIHNVLAKAFGMQPTNIDFGQEVFNVNNPDIGDKAIQGLATYAPWGVVGKAAETIGAVPEIAGSIAANSPKLASFVSQAIPNAIANAGMVGTQSENPLSGAGIGAGASIALDALPFGVGKAIQSIQPSKYAEQFLNMLSKGKDWEGNAKSLADNIVESFNKNKNEVSDIYNPIFKAVGNKKLYPEVSNLQGYGATDLSDVIANSRLKSLHNDFVRRPTFDNAHRLQSDIGKEIRAIDPTTYADRNKQLSLMNAQDALKADMDIFLRNKSPELADKYMEATQKFAENVAPYLENTKINKIATGEINNPKNIQNIFSSPGKDVEKIAQDLGEEGLNRIIFDSLTRSKTKLTPESLQKKIGDLQKGLGSYISPSAEEAINQFNKSMSRRDIAQKAGGAIGGALAGAGLSHFLPVGQGAIEALGALGGLAAAPGLGKALNAGGLMPGYASVSGAPGYATEFLRYLSPALKALAISNLER